MAFDQRRRSEQETTAGRYVIALWMALTAWLIFISSTIFGLLNDNTGILAPLESTINTIVIVALAYGLLTAEYAGRTRAETVFSVTLMALLLVGLGYTLQTWDTQQDFYSQSISVSWVFMALILCASATLLLLWRYRHVADIPLKILFFAALIAGHGYTLREQLNNQQLGDAAGAVRWSMMLSGFLMLLILYRMVIERMTHAVHTVANYAETISRPLRTIGMPSGNSNELEVFGGRLTAETAGTSGLGGRNEALSLLKALGIMLDKTDTNAIPSQTVQAVSDLIKGDVVALIAYEDANWADVIAAYDFGRQQPIAGMSINLDDQPTLFHALDQKKHAFLNPETQLTEVKGLYARLDMALVGNTYIQPLTRQGVVVGALLVGFPYNQRELGASELRLLESIAPIAARLMMISRTARIERVQAEERAIMQLVEGNGFESSIDIDEAMLEVRREMQASLELAQNEIDDLNRTIQKLESDLRKEQAKLREVVSEDNDEDALSITQKIEIITVERESLQQERRQLASALQQAQATLIGVTADDQVEAYREMTAQLQEEIDALKLQRDRIASQLSEVRSSDDAVEKVRNLLDTLTADNTQLEANSQQIQAKLEDTQTQLSAMGLQSDFQGMMDQIAKLKEEREYYKNQAQRAAHERELLLKERQNIEQAIQQEQERSDRIATLEQQVARLAEDREVLLKQRNTLNIQRESLTSAAKEWQTERDSLLQQQADIEAAKNDALTALSQATEAQQDLISERNVLKADNDRLQHEYQALLARVDGNRERLQAINEASAAPMQTLIDELNAARTDLEHQLAQALQDVNYLQQQLHARADSNGTTQAVDMDVLVALAQELRSPLSVIMGYTDIVLGESVGILGAPQRKLLTRVKANVDRLVYLVEELIQIAIIDSGGINLEPKKVNIVDFIDEAIAATNYRFSEKAIVIDLDLAADDIFLQADEEALRQIINHLVQNAYLISPIEGVVKISAGYAERIDVPAPNPQIIENAVVVAIQDQGGGIRQEDATRVFKRHYRAENPLIEGLGDTGVGMSIAKALIESHSGRIWVSSTPERGINIFMFAMPIQQPILQANEASLAPSQD